MSQLRKIDDVKIREMASRTQDRVSFCADFITSIDTRRMAEIGVYRGGYATKILAACPTIETYYMIDPWQHLDDWHKPTNKNDQTFSKFYAEMQRNTDFAATKRVILRGRTTEVIDQIPEESLDFVYIDGDHTLRGITIDLLRAYPKVRPGGWICGDDFTSSVWQHNVHYEPTFVFPLAVHFAEGMGLRITGLPHNQFLIEKPESGHATFEFNDLTASYTNTALRGQIYPDLRQRVADLLSIEHMRKRLTDRFRDTPFGDFAKGLLRR